MVVMKDKVTCWKKREDETLESVLSYHSLDETWELGNPPSET